MCFGYAGAYVYGFKFARMKENKLDNEDFMTKRILLKILIASYVHILSIHF